MRDITPAQNDRFPKLAFKPSEIQNKSPGDLVVFSKFGNMTLKDRTEKANFKDSPLKTKEAYPMESKN